MINMKKASVLFLTLVFAVGCMAGCGGANGSASGKGTGSDEKPSAAENSAGGEAAGSSAASAAGGAFETATYSLNQPNPESETDAFYTLSRLFADKVHEKTGGAVTINIYSNAQLGSGGDAALGVEMGTIDFNVDSTNVFSGEYTKLAVCDLPYMFDNVNDVMEFCSSEYMQQMQAEMADNLGVRLLGFGDGGFRAVWSTKGNIHSVADYKGLKIRVPDVEIYVDTFNAVGANATPMSGAEVFTSLQQGTIDGCEVPLSVGISQGFTEACDYVTMDNHLYNLLSIQCSEKVWKTMSGELQKVMLEAAAEAQEEQIKHMADVQQELIDTIVGDGCTYVDENQVDFTGIREAVKPVYESWRSKIGPEFYDACMKWFDEQRS